ncbi:MAG: DUF4230 domain-containing protein [Spirochaetes bacterium]|nr:MAG: DUF4230 domain-containing protein [Spirochaetota bacterium]
MKKFLLPVFFILLTLSCRERIRPVSATVIENQIRSLLEIPTVEYVYREILYFDEEARFLGIKHMDKRLLFSVDMVTRAGFDLSKGLEVRRIFNSVKITLPKPEILEVDADEESIHQFFVKEWGGKISRLDYYDELNLRKEGIRKDAVKRGILDKARKNFEGMVSKLATSFDLESVNFEYR